jgi:hypothetical protein
MAFSTVSSPSWNITIKFVEVFRHSKRNNRSILESEPPHPRPLSPKGERGESIAVFLPSPLWGLSMLHIFRWTQRSDL